jgi:hypothetical protein
VNDFTKEELELIGYCFENISQRKFMENKGIQPLYLRIRSMIDNYCKHENIVTGKYPRSNPPVKCDSCGILHYE